MQDYHKPVLIDEVLSLMDPKEGGVYLDATLGGGGHSEALLKRIDPNGVLIGLDRDQDALDYAGERLSGFKSRVILVQDNFANVASVLSSAGINELDGALFDLGVSSYQLDADRGFTFMRDEDLDMRMSQSEDTLTAAEIVNSYTETNLAQLIWEYGEERYSRRIARAIVKSRQSKPIRSTKELADIIVSAIPGGGRWQDIHPATRSFQAIRIKVNRELEAIEKGVPAAIEALKIGGKICVISFHSLEDRIVKGIFRRLSGRCECPPRFPQCQCGAKKELEILTKKPIGPNEQETEENPRSRSSKLRCAVRVM